MVEKTRIYTVGYPRSGNTWLGRLLSDVLSSPIQTFAGEPLVYAGQSGGDYVIHKTHWPVQEREGKDTDLRVFIQRDPRDVAVSAMFYHESTLDDVIATMVDPQRKVPNPIYHLRGWYLRFVIEWVARTDLAAVRTRYEWLQEDREAELDRILSELSVVDVDPHKIQAAYEQQRFKHQPPSHAVRKGIVGDWRNHFHRAQGQYFEEYLGDFMRAFHYETNPDWWRKLPR